MKRGFTLVEIIISIALILILGTGSAVFVVNKNKNNNLEKITKEILEAGSAYIKIEKDENGRVLANEVVKGAKGVKVPVSNLVSRGYLDESIKNELYSLVGSPNSTNDYYVMFVQEGGDYCTENEIKGISSWMEKGNDVYLCDEYGTGGGDLGGGEHKLVDLLLDKAYFVSKNVIYAKANIYTAFSTTPSNTYPNANYVMTDSIDGDAVTVKTTENGYFERDGTYYFRGDVTDNYVSFPTIDVDATFRIISFNENEIKLIKEKPIENFYYSNASGDYTTLPDSKVFNALKSWYNDFLSSRGSWSDWNDPNYVNVYLDAYKDIFVNAKFCHSNINHFPSEYIENEYNTSLHSFDEITMTSTLCTGSESTNFNSPYGLLHIDEAIFAGAYGKRAYNSLSGYAYSGVFNNYWLGSGGTTCIMDSYSGTVGSRTYNFNYAIVNSFGTRTQGVMHRISGGCVLRPVVVVDPNKISFTGHGTSSRPYKIKPISLSS